ncbi:MAG: VanZ family protein [Synechococcales bacterium]|nr:VanZ family protein [Synechococcales bacterium]
MPQSTRSRSARTWPHWSLLLLAVSVVFILYVTLTPFDFRLAQLGARNLVKEFFRHSSDSQDLVSNVLLFLPIGLSWTAWQYRHQRQGSRQPVLWRLWVRSILFSFLLTLTVELLQIFLPTRYTSYRDLTTNTLGGAIGAGLYLVGLRYHLWHQVWHHLQRLWRSPRGLATLLVVWVICGCSVTLALHKGTELSNWARDYPLVIGNEPSGDRPWRGQISRLVISPQATSEQAAADWLTQPQQADLPGAIADYDFTTVPPYRSRVGHGTVIDWNQPLDQPTEQQTGLQTAAITQADRWLIAQGSPASLTEPIRQSSTFTLAAIVQAAEFEHEETARIISISQDPYFRNLTVGQKGDVLTIRLRTPLTGENGTYTSLGVPKVFVDSQPHALLVTYQAGQLTLYIDQVSHDSTLILRPEVTLFRYLLPWSFLQFNLTPKGMLAYRFLYYALFSLPLGFWVGRLLWLSHSKHLTYTLMVVGGLLIPCWLFAQFLSQAWLPNLLTWLVCLGLSGLTVGLVYWRSRWSATARLECLGRGEMGR